jgi:hypothetical protein
MAAKKKVPQPTYVLRTCAANMSTYGGFIWPESGLVEAPDWSPKAVCGCGLHGLLMGEGDQSHFSVDEDAKWLVVAVAPDTLVDLIGTVKFPRGEVVFCGDMHGAAEFIIAKGADPVKVPGGIATAGNRGIATAGYRGTATAGYRGTATAGNRGTATAGDSGTATAAYCGTATAGKDGVLVIMRWDGKRYKLAVANVGENGIEPNKPYRLDDEGAFIPVVVENEEAS